MIMTYKLWKW